MLRPIARNVKAFISASVLAAMLAAASSPVLAKETDFPPGAFSDGGRYKLSDYEGKVVVLFFYEQDCPRCRGLIPERNKVVDQFKDKPVKFFAVAPGDTRMDTLAYTRDTRLNMPAFSDLFGVMQGRYGVNISLRNIYQFVVIGPKGNIVERNSDMNPGDIEKALADAKFKYKDGGYHASLNQIVDALEWGQYPQAIAALKVATKSPKKEIAESAKKLMDAVKAEGKAWLDEAAKASESDPVKAFDLYKKVSLSFPGDDLAKQADAGLKPLAKNKPLSDELAARSMYEQLAVAGAKAQKTQKMLFVQQANLIASKYPETPTGKRAKEFAGELEAATVQ
jgi:peroxiredoxin